MKPTNTLADLLDAQVPAERTALIALAADGSEQCWSYAALREAIAVRRSELSGLGLPAGSVVATGPGNTAATWIDTLAAWQAGLAVMPVNGRASAEAQEAMLDDAGVAACIARGGAATLRAANAAPVPGRALVMFTSGSTGRPKAVAIGHEGYVWAVRQFGFLRPVLEGKVGLVAAPLHHMNGQFHLLHMLWCGATVVLMAQFDALAFGRAIEAHRVARVTGVPTMLALLVRAADAGARFDFSHVASVGMGSAPFSDELLARARVLFPNATLSNGWGTTETGPAAFGLHPAGRPTPPLAIGHPIEGVEVKLVNEAGGVEPEVGTLWLRTPMTLTGYLNDTAASARAVQDGWFVTGDRMRRDAEGFFYFLGRADDRMQVGGENVYPIEVERVLESHPAVAQAAVVALPDAAKHEVPVAFVVLEPGQAADEAALKAHALAQGPAYAHPRRVAVLDAMPLSAANKIDRKLLARWALERFGPRA
jgi:long-chain acyl-CoA synthetase